MKPLDLIRIEFGGIKELADKLGLTPNTVYLWGVNRVPLKYLAKIEELSNLRLTREQLRPDLFKKD
jgi:DNA-binding transcriptional regulator YdaS (Cro superfamily)